MSVILDALRRGRDDAPTSGGPHPRARRVPQGLGLDRPAMARTEPGLSRWLWASIVLLVVIGVWVAVRVISRPSSELTAVGAVPSSAPAAPRGADSVTPSDRSEAMSQARTTEGRPEVSALAPAAAAAPQPPRRSRAGGPGADTRPAPVTPGSVPAAPLSPPPPPPVDHFELAVRYQALGDYAQARTHYLAVLAADEFQLEALNNLGLLYHAQGLTEDAITTFRRALSVNPRYLKARSNLAVVLTKAGRLDEARAELRAARDVDPRNADVLVNMALVDRADGQAERALELLLRAVAVEPSNAAAHYNLGVLYDERGSRALAYDHYAAFLRYAGPEHGTLLADVRRRVDRLKPLLDDTRP